MEQENRPPDNKELDRSILARQKREAEQQKRLQELRAQAAAAQAQREHLEQDRRKRQLENRRKDEERRKQVEERRRALKEAEEARKEALLARDREREERLQRTRATRRSPQEAGIVFGATSPRVYDSYSGSGTFWGSRRATSTLDVMSTYAQLTRGYSMHIKSDYEKSRDESNTSQPPVWSSVARRRTDLMPTLPAPRNSGRAYSSMTRLDKIPPQRPLHSASPSMYHLNRTHNYTMRSGDTSPGSRPGSSMSSSTGAIRRRPRSQRPVTIAGTGVDTGVGANGDSNTTPSMSRDSTVAGSGDVPVPEISITAPPASPRDRQQRIRHSSMRRPRNFKVSNKDLSVATAKSPADGKPPVPPETAKDNNKVVEHPEIDPEKQKDNKEKIEEEPTAKRSITEEEAKAALAERRRLARELKKIEQERIKKEQEEEERRLNLEKEEEERIRQLEEEKRKQDEEEAREMARLCREIDELKLRRAIEAQEKQAREEAERKAREYTERLARLKEDEQKKKAADEAERLRKEEAEREEKERLLRKQRVEAIMVRTRLNKENKNQNNAQKVASESNNSTPAKPNNGNTEYTPGEEEIQEDANEADESLNGNVQRGQDQNSNTENFTAHNNRPCLQNAND